MRHFNKHFDKHTLARQRKRSDQIDKRIFSHISGIRTVSGYHFGYKICKSTSKYRKGQTLKIPYIDVEKPYVFKVTDRTHHLNSCRVGNTATVLTKHGKRNLTVTKVTDEPADDKKAQGRMPVVNFQKRSLKDGHDRFAWLYQHYVEPSL